ncbi:zinc-ribbon domain-containing protein, partial [candidate division TA06 bacterium]|nr:zinc-ribbon domain-containing protein [candidate division TA06 bacterium]
MVILCPKCETKYQVEEGEITSGGAGVSCPKCKNVFTIYKEVSPIELV